MHRRVALASTVLIIAGAVLGGAVVAAAPAWADPTPVPSGPGPVAAVVAPDGSKVYVVNRSAGTVSVLTSAGAIVSTIPVGVNPFGIAVSHDGAHVYVTTDTPAQVADIDTKTDTVVRNIAAGFGFPSALAVSPDDSTLYVSNVTARFAAVDLADPSLTRYTELQTASRGIALSSDGTTAYVALPGVNAITRIDTATMTEVLPRIAVGAEPWSVTINEKRDEIYVANGDSASVSVIPLGGTAVTETIPVASGPRNVRISPDGDRVYVAGLDAAGMTVINRATGSVDPVPGGATSEGLTVGPAGNRVFLTDAANGGQLLLYSRAAFTGPTDATVPEGASVTFSSTVVNEADGLQWQTSTDGGVTWTDVPGATSSDYTFTPALGQSGSLFRLLVSSIVFSDTPSPVARLTVTPTPIPPTPTPAPGGGLAATGADILPTLLAALLLVSAGTGALLLRPRRRS